MNFKNFLKLISLPFLAVPTLAVFTGDCATIYNILQKDYEYLKTIGEDVPSSSSHPLQTCKVNYFGQVTEISLISRQNRVSAIESALAFNSITKLTYNINSGTLYESIAYDSEVPKIISKLTNLEEFALYYFNGSREDEKTNYYESLDIDSSVLTFSSNKLKKLSLQMVEITNEVINSIKRIPSLKELHIYTLEGDDTDYRELINISGVDVSIHTGYLPFIPS